MNSKTFGLIAAVLACGLLASASWGADNVAFLEDVIRGSLAEVKMGQLAQQNGGTEDVRSFGAKLVADHLAVKDQAAILAKSTGAQVPNEPTPAAKDEYEHLQTLSGADFDKVFAAHMVMDHIATIQKFEEQAKAGGDEVAQFANASLPILQEHLDIAEDLAKQAK
jgi:putative membrane protein